MKSASFNTGVFERTDEEVASLELGKLQNAWHENFAESEPSDKCAGCGDQIGEARILTLIDGARVHFGRGDYKCLILYGQRWRAEATEGLRDLGLIHDIS